MKPFRLLDDSLKQFIFGLLPAFVMAFVCLAVQLVLWTAIGAIHSAVSPREPFDIFVAPPVRFGWRHQMVELFGHTAGLSILFFFHALVALILTAWLLRSRAAFDALGVLRRAARGAGIVTGAAAILFAVSFVLDHFLPATRYLRIDFHATAMLTLWFGGTALLLPARLMGHAPATSAGLPRTTFVAALALLPFFFISEIVGGPLRRCSECWGLFEGGLFTIPLLGAYLLGLTVSSAAVSAAACMPTEPTERFGGGRREAAANVVS